MDLNQPNQSGQAPLFRACAVGGHLAVVKTLLANGAVVNHQSNDGTTAFDQACCGGFPEIVNTLLAHRADVGLSAEDGRTPLHWACLGERFGDRLAIVKILLDHGAEVNRPDNHGKTPLHWVCKMKKTPKLAKCLLKYGADLFSEDYKGRMPVSMILKRRKFCKELTTAIESGELHLLRPKCDFKSILLNCAPSTREANEFVALFKQQFPVGQHTKCNRKSMVNFSNPPRP